MINTELGYRDQRLHFTNTLERSGVSHWRLANAVEEQTPSGNVTYIAVSGNGSSLLGVGFTEQWSWRDNAYVFSSSNLRFSIVGDEVTRPIRFRLEWAEREIGTDGTLQFPGKGAAHPHWQFDGDLRLLESLAEEGPPAEDIDIQQDEIVALPINEVVEDLTDLLAESGVRPIEARVDLGWFHKLHLPARAQWSDQMCSMPDDAVTQQHSPKHIDDLDRWVISALRYLRHEFELYST